MDGYKRKVLVLEDERSLQQAIRDKLEQHNFTVVSARTVAQAKTLITEDNPVDIIWLDHYLLGNESGLDFLIWCKEEHNTLCNTIPIFVVSNTASDDKVASYLRLGVTDYYVKSNHRLDDIVKDIVDYCSLSPNSAG